MPVDRLCGCADMPIPTDTFWNIKKLNRAFAVSAFLLVVVTLCSVMPLPTPAEQLVDYVREPTVEDRASLEDEFASLPQL